jgi:hypothetical protein
MDDRVEGRRRGVYIALVILLVLIGGFFLLGLMAGIIGACGSAATRMKNHESFAGDVSLAVVSALIVVACGAGIVHLEHQLRRHHPVARAWSSPPDGGRSELGSPFGMPRRRGRRYSPVAVGFQVFVFTAVFIGMLVGTVVTHSEAVRSARVQHHGVARLATVLSVHDSYHSSRGGGYWTATVDAAFVPPDEGVSNTVVHYPGWMSSQPGSRYTVLLDPTDPGYAEFPGSPATKSWSWVLLLVFALVFGVIDGLLVRTHLRLWRHRRGVAPGQLPGTPAWPAPPPPGQ